MSKLTHRNNRAANNHSLYQTNLLTDHTQLLTDIKDNTANISLNVDTLEVNTDGLEALQTTANATLASILIDTDAADSSLNTIEAQSVLTASRLNNIQNKISANVDGTGDTLGQIAADIASKAGSIKTSVELIDNAISGNEMQVDVVAALPAGTNRIGMVALKANEAVDGSGTERHLVTDANGFLQVEDQTNTILAPTVNLADSTQTQRVNLALHDSGNSTTRTAKCNASGELLVNAAGTVTANLSATDNAVLDDIASKAGSIKTAVELIDNAISGNEIQADIVASLPAGDNNIGNVDLASAIPAGTNKIGAVAIKANEAVDGSGTERHLVTDANGFLQVEDQTNTVIAPTVNLSESTQTQRVNIALHDSGNSTTRTAKCNASGELLVNAAGTVTANLSATDNAVLDDIAQKAGDIETSVQLIDDIVKAEDAAHSSGDKGVMFLGVRQSSQADFGADGDYVPISINDDGEIRVTSSGASGGATEAKQDVIETTLTNLETSLAALDNAVDGNYLNVNLNLAGSDVEANSGNKSAATPRVVVATDDVNLSAIKTAVELIDDAISGSEMQCDIVAALPSGNNNIGNVDIASALPAGTNAIGKLAANDGVDIGDVDVTSISAGTNRIGMVALKANENVGGTGTERHLLCDSAGHLQVDVVSAPSTAVTGTVTANLSATDNAVLDAIDAVLDTIKVDTEAIETAVEALNTRDALTTTLIIDGQSVASGGGTHTSSSFEITNIPKGDGKLKFLIRISGVSPGDIQPSVQVSADDTNFFGLDLGFTNTGTATTGVGLFLTCSFIAKHIKITLENQNFSSNATCTVHMFN